MLRLFVRLLTSTAEFIREQQDNVTEPPKQEKRKRRHRLAKPRAPVGNLSRPDTFTPTCFFISFHCLGHVLEVGHVSEGGRGAGQRRRNDGEVAREIATERTGGKGERIRFSQTALPQCLLTLSPSLYPSLPLPLSHPHSSSPFQPSFAVPFQRPK